MHYVLSFGLPGYIADPYRPEMYRLIEIQKQSGMMRARTDANRRRALEQHLRLLAMSHDDYLALEKAAKEPFWRNGKGEIIIPAASVLACLVNTVDVAPSKVRIQNLRSALSASDFRTDKQKPDGAWERFVVVTGAQGKLSNQRGYRSNAYIRDFSASGEIKYDPEMVHPEALLALLVYAGREVGIGASRKMGWGRFTVVNG